MVVLMFHSIGLEKSNWVDNYLSIPICHFANWFKYMHLMGYKTSFLDEWYQSPEESFIKNDKKLIITFDDGYLDNWIYLYPLLEKYQIKATVFINPEFIDPSKEIRPNLNDVWSGKIENSDLQDKGFLNWSEILLMHQSGLVDFQSHSMSHNWYFTNNYLIDIYNSNSYNKYYWINWYLSPQSKYRYVSEDHSKLIPLGYPVFTYGRSLGIRRYFPNHDFIQHIMNCETINKDKQTETIRKFNKKLINKEYHGSLETDQQMIDRYIYELKESKILIEQKLRKSVDFLCWPGGAYNNISLAISEIVGYKASTLPSWERQNKIDFKKDYKRIPRFSLGTIINYKGKSLIDPNPNALKNNFMEFEGNVLKKYYRYGKKVFYLAFK